MYFLSFLSVDKNMNYSDLRGSAISASHPLKVTYFKISPIVTDNLFVRFRKPFRCDKYLCHENSCPSPTCRKVSVVLKWLECTGYI